MFWGSDNTGGKGEGVRLSTELGIPGFEIEEVLDQNRNRVMRCRVSADATGRLPLVGRALAIKVVSPAFEPILPKRFNRSRRQLTQLAKTPGWVPLLEHGVTTDGLRYVVSPYFADGSLADRLTQGPLSWEEACEIITAVAGNLARAHDIGLALGDLRPSNLLLTGSSPSIGAFGMATRRFDDGTPEFLAPEVVSGERPTPPSDIYSLTLILAALVVGRPLERAEALSSYLADVRAAVPTPLFDLIDYGLSPNRMNRFAEANTMLRAILNCTEQINNQAIELDEAQPGGHDIVDAAYSEIPAAYRLKSTDADGTDILDDDDLEDGLDLDGSPTLTFNPKTSEIFGVAGGTAAALGSLPPRPRRKSSSTAPEVDSEIDLRDKPAEDAIAELEALVDALKSKTDNDEAAEGDDNDPSSGGGMASKSAHTPEVDLPDDDEPSDFNRLYRDTNVVDPIDGVPFAPKGVDVDAPATESNSGTTGVAPITLLGRRFGNLALDLVFANRQAAAVVATVVAVVGFSATALLVDADAQAVTEIDLQGEIERATPEPSNPTTQIVEFDDGVSSNEGPYFTEPPQTHSTTTLTTKARPVTTRTRVAAAKPRPAATASKPKPKPVQPSVKKPVATLPAPVATVTPRPVATLPPSVPTTRVQPVVTTRVRPVATTRPEPVATTRVRPVATTRPEPVATTRVRPVPTTRAKPVATTRVRPVVTTRVQPVTTTRAKPVVTTRVQPVTTTRAKPVATTRVKPVATTRAKPVTTTRAKPVTTTRAKPVATTRAKPVATTRAKPVTTTRAKPVTTTRAKPAATVAPKAERTVKQKNNGR